MTEHLQIHAVNFWNNLSQAAFGQVRLGRLKHDLLSVGGVPLKVACSRDYSVHCMPPYSCHVLPQAYAISVIIVCEATRSCGIPLRRPL